MVLDARTHLVFAEEDGGTGKPLLAKLRAAGHRHSLVTGWNALEDLLRKDPPSVLVLDARFDSRLDPEQLRRWQAENPLLTVLVLAPKGAASDAEVLCEAGAFDVVSRPVDSDRLLRQIAKAVDHHQLKRRIRSLERLVEGPKGIETLIGGTLPARRVRDLVQNIAPTASPLLLSGESGTGKRFVAQLIHRLSGRKGRFVGINLAAIPVDLMEGMLFGCEKGALPGVEQSQAGYFENADGGTAYIVDIAELDPQLQPKVLRLIQEGTLQRLGSAKLRKVDVRVLAGTRSDLAAAVKDGSFREDLYYTLSGVTVSLPPLRDRRDDVAALALHFAETAAARYKKPLVTFSARALDHLRFFSWPGNTRQLEGMVERMVLTATDAVIDEQVLPVEIINTHFILDVQTTPPRADEKSAVAAGMKPYEVIEKRAILEALGQTKGHVGRAAQILGYGQATVYRKIKRFGIPLKATYS
ncbi:MAG TPA: sigma-54 dependent transcriptional regulator [Gemmatales bacterium]|nr:sigma-54 dependent transcriptional regulator [Gemmatales bacterium]HMP58383.1 sigma-54 dependent transcriptional regulator [Gemmatales bacterium]